MSQIITILPALNAAAHLERTLQSLTEAERAGLSAGWVLADGGSTDGTVQIARRAGCQVVTGRQGTRRAAGAGRGPGAASDRGVGLAALPARRHPPVAGLVKRGRGVHDRQCASRSGGVFSLYAG
jgi:glycosyltransferase involved in cell wall biosynthesis